jgi:tellurite resistance protein TehA-like permease
MKELRWTPAWNAIIFPNGTLATSFSVFAIEMDSDVYRVITCVFIIGLVIAYLINLFMTLLRIWEGKLLIVREDWRVQQEMDDDQKEK